jgi:UPF0755 protein
MPRKTTRHLKVKSVARGRHALSGLTALGLLVLLAYAWIRLAIPVSPLGSPHPQVSMLDAYWLRARLGRNVEMLTTTHRGNFKTGDFFVAPGESASAVSQRLAARSIVPDARLLRDYLVYKGLDSQIEAGFFQFHPSMTTIDVAAALTDAIPSEVRFHMWAGWRLEQAADALSQHPHLAVDRNTFLTLGARELPLPGDYSFLSTLPPDATLEGLLYPGDYVLAPRSTAPEVLSMMLSAFDRESKHLSRLANNRNLSLHQFVTLASIVQRETMRESEAPLIAGVFLNRLALGMPLAADPTVQYALATPTDWWPPISIDPRLVEHPYNTYLPPGLPPGPIASPGASILESVGNPAPTEFLYFRAVCDGSGRHNFSRTYREHLLWQCEP